MTSRATNRRDFLALAGLGGLVFSAALPGCGSPTPAPRTAASRAAPASDDGDFFFLQLSDTHWGFEGPANPQAMRCLAQTVHAINAVEAQPDFVVFTGDLTHKTDDPAQRRDRLREFRTIVAELRSSKLVFLPGEHDAAADGGEAYREVFGDLYQSFAHRGVHFIALDNASAPGGTLGAPQLDWLAGEVAKVPRDAALVVLAHRPLFELYPEWDWSTTDGARAIEVLSAHPNVSVFYGHIHQEHHHVTGKIAHHSARSLIFPLPAPAAAQKRAPLPWDPASRDHGLGHRSIRVAGASADLAITEVPFVDAAAAVARARCSGAVPQYEAEVAPVLERRCFQCHSADGPAADEHDFSNPSRAFAQRREIFSQVRAGAMPPPKSPALTEDERNLLLRWATCEG